MYVTILSGHVSHENWTTLQKDYQEKVTRRPPRALVESVLVQSEDDSTLWHIISIWQSKEAFQQAEDEDEASLCVRLFCDAGEVPTRRCYQLEARYVRV